MRSGVRSFYRQTYVALFFHTLASMNGPHHIILQHNLGVARHKCDSGYQIFINPQGNQRLRHLCNERREHTACG